MRKSYRGISFLIKVHVLNFLESASEYVPVETTSDSQAVHGGVVEGFLELCLQSEWVNKGTFVT